LHVTLQTDTTEQATKHMNTSPADLQASQTPASAEPGPASCRLRACLVFFLQIIGPETHKFC
jgi:hypothetical protein